MGTYRLILAYVVVAYHLSFTYYVHIGVVAVVSFLVISGFVMTALVERNYSELGRVPTFLLDRALRIGPQYLFYLSASMIAFFFKLLGPDITHSKCTTLKIVANFFILPFQFNSLGGLWQCQFLPQAWSLGLEAWFYLIIPFIILFKLRAPMTLISVGIFVCAYFGILDGSLHTYRLLTGTLFIFLAGSYIYTGDRIIVWAVWLVSIVWFVAILINSALNNNIDMFQSVLLGIVLAIPTVEILKEFRFSAWDEFAGNISYGIFLNHVLINWLLPAHIGNLSIYMRLAAVPVISTLLSILTYYFIERPVISIRRSLRYRRAIPLAPNVIGSPAS